MAQHVLFLRGINLGKRQVKMAELKQALETLGYAGAQTLIASGNALIESDQAPDTAAIEAGLERHFGFRIGVVTRSLGDLEALIASDPFDGEVHGEQQHLFATFANGPLGSRTKSMESVPGVVTFTRFDADQFFAIGYRQANGRYSEWGARAEDPFKDIVITTRNWNTILRMVDKARASRDEGKETGKAGAGAKDKTEAKRK